MMDKEICIHCGESTAGACAKCGDAVCAACRETPLMRQLFAICYLCKALGGDKENDDG